MASKDSISKKFRFSENNACILKVTNIKYIVKIILFKDLRAKLNVTVLDLSRYVQRDTSYTGMRAPCIM